MIKNEKGYVLLESLIGLMLLSILSATFLQTAPLLLEAKMQLDHQQGAYNQLFQIRTQNISRGIFATECLIYEWRSFSEEICL